MRGATFGMAILAVSAVALIQAPLALAGEPVAGTWRPRPPPTRTLVPVTPRPVISPPRPALPQPVVTAPRSTPPPPPPPLTVKIAKPNYSKRTMALIQQNIAMQAALRNSRSWAPAQPCKASWSQAKLRRKGCLATPAQVQPDEQRSQAMLADARLCASAVEGADCGAMQAARDRSANGRW